MAGKSPARMAVIVAAFDESADPVAKESAAVPKNTLAFEPVLLCAPIFNRLLQAHALMIGP
jgi:hypothetical protein